mgnify:FL=1
MFNYWKELGWELYGYDVAKMKNEKKQKKIEKEKNIIFLNRTTKIVINILSVIYLPICWLSLDGYYHTQNYIGFFFYILMAFLDIGIIVLSNIKKRQTELIAIVGILIFILLNMLLPIILL